MLQHLWETSSETLGVSNHHALGVLASNEKGRCFGRAGVCGLRGDLCVLLHGLVQAMDSQDPWVECIF